MRQQPFLEPVNRTPGSRGATGRIAAALAAFEQLAGDVLRLAAAQEATIAFVLDRATDIVLDYTP